jgi:hypothetical protein
MIVMGAVIVACKFFVRAVGLASSARDCERFNRFHWSSQPRESCVTVDVSIFDDCVYGRFVPGFGHRFPSVMVLGQRSL